MSENVLKLGAVVNIAEYKSGMEQLAATTRASTAEMAAATRSASASMTGDWHRVAESTVELRSAKRELRQAMRDTIGLAAGEESAVNRLSLALQSQAEASLKVRAATSAANASIAESAAVIKESSASMRGMFSVMTEFIEAGLIIEYVNHLKESSLQMGHLSEATGVSVQELTELKAAMNAAGVSTERLPQQLTHLAQQIAAASQGSKEAIHNFHQLGISTDDWKGTLPSTIDVLSQMSQHLHDGSAATNELAAASHILGRNAYETVAFLKQGDDAVRKQMGSFRELGEATAANVSSARQLQAEESRLSSTLQTNLLPVFGFLVKGIASVAAAIDLLKGAFQAAVAYASSWVRAVLAAFYDLGQAIDAVKSGQFEKLPALMGKTMADVVKQINIGANEVDGIWDEAFKKANENFQSFADQTEKGSDDIIKDQTKAGKSRVDAWREELNQKKLAADAFHDVSLKDELEFWATIRAQQQLSKKEQLSIDSELVRLRKEIKKQGLQDEIAGMNQELAATKSGSRERLALLQKELAQLKAEGKEETEAYKQKLREQAAAQREFDESQKRLNQELALEDLNFEKDMDLLKLKGRKDEFDAEMSIRHIGYKDVQKEELKFAAEEHRITAQALKDKLKILEKDPTLNATEIRRLHHQVELEEQRFENAKNKINDKAAKHRLEVEKTLDGGIRSSLQSMVSGFLDGTQTIGQAFANMGKTILEGMLDMMANMLANFIETEILMKVFKISTEKEKMLASVQASAAEAGAAGTASWAGAPWPIDAGAPAFGQAMFDAAGAYALSGIAERGALVPRNMPIFAHAEEMILPAPLSRGLQSLISGGGPSGANSGGGGIKISPVFHASALDARGLDPMLKQFERGLVRKLKGAVRTGRLNLQFG